MRNVILGFFGSTMLLYLLFSPLTYFIEPLVRVPVNIARGGKNGDAASRLRKQVNQCLALICQFSVMALVFLACICTLISPATLLRKFADDMNIEYMVFELIPAQFALYAVCIGTYHFITKYLALEYLWHYHRDTCLAEPDECIAKL